MDMETSNENADADLENPQPPPQQPNTLQNDHPSGSPIESHPTTPANGDPVSQPNSQPAVESSNEPNAQPDGHPGTQTLPSGHGTLTEEEPVDPKGLLEPFGWDDLDERFAQRMHECQRQEGEIANEFKEWGQVGSSFLLLPPTLSILLGWLGALWWKEDEKDYCSTIDGEGEVTDNCIRHLVSTGRN